MDQSYHPRLRPEFYERLRQAGRELAQVREQVEVMRERIRADKSDGAKDLAEFARSAKAPSDLQAVQHRIDRGEITWEQVLTGDVNDKNVDHLLFSTKAAFTPIAQLFETADQIVQTEDVSSTEATELAIDRLKLRREAPRG